MTDKERTGKERNGKKKKPHLVDDLSCEIVDPVTPEIIVKLLLFRAFPPER